MINYGITLERYNEMFAAQRGCCAICLRHATEFKRGLQVDQHHNSTRVRALLCSNCNIGIGFFAEDQQLLYSAIQYLNTHGETAKDAVVSTEGG